MHIKQIFSNIKQQSYLLFYFLLLALLFSSCQQEKNIEFDNKNICDVINKMTNIMVHDVTNPPLASRFFSYACIAGYEVVSENDSSIKKLQGILNEYPEIKIPAAKANADYKLAALLAMMETAKKNAAFRQVV